MSLVQIVVAVRAIAKSPTGAIATLFVLNPFGQNTATNSPLKPPAPQAQSIHAVEKSAKIM
ncbi:MAG: hypothetical protein AAF773_21960 [Cyanobacteria bacterium P01_D01_bin.115]